jgi:hypothetical protein
MLGKWKRAVIHLECATDSETWEERKKRIEAHNQMFEKGETPSPFPESGPSRDIRFEGTALFLLHAGRRYLLTARHVLHDEISAKRELEEEEQRALSWPEHMRQDLLNSAAERAQTRIFNIIFRVRSLDELITVPFPELLMNLGSGVTDFRPYTFSDPELDLALISLDQQSFDRRFADELQKLGYSPISSDDIAGGPDAEGQDVFTVGFPPATARIDEIDQDPGRTYWSSGGISLPVSSFGKVSMLHEALSFFWADMSILPGNSGGPVVANDRLVGIVSAQAAVPIDDVPTVRTRFPFAKIIKSKFVHRLLEEQEVKDRWHSAVARP